MSKNIIREIRIGTYLAIVFYFSVILLYAILLYIEQLSFMEFIIILVNLFIILSIFIFHLSISYALENIIKTIEENKITKNDRNNH